MLMKLFDKIFLLFLATVIFTIILTALGWVKLLVVKTGSMAPKISVNSLVLVIPGKSIFSSSFIYQKGDVISFKPISSSLLITHRIVKVISQKGETFYQTKGDANPTVDPVETTQKNVLGKMVFSFPFLGIAATFLNSFLGLFLLVILPASVVILHEVLVIEEEIKILRGSKKILLSLGIIFCLLFLATPVVAFFSGSSILVSNSLTTKETFLADHLVINEVYYQVDPSHGVDSAKDRNKTCSSSGNSSVSINNSVTVESDTGGNTASDNTGGNVSINTGSSSAKINISNKVRRSCGQNNEWVELFNPTNQGINLKNWSLTDNSGFLAKITVNETLKAGSFALLTKDKTTWNFWSVPSMTLVINLGKQIGDGLDNSGDRLLLKNPSGNVIDALSYGNDISVFNPSIPLVSSGDSFERTMPGFDTNLARDFVERHPPTPGE